MCNVLYTIRFCVLWDPISFPTFTINRKMTMVDQQLTSYECFGRFVSLTLLLFCLFVFGTTVGQGLLIHEVSRSHTTMHHSR